MEAGWINCNQQIFLVAILLLKGFVFLMTAL